MNTKALIILGIVVAVVIGSVSFFRGSATKPSPTSGSTGLIVGNNAIYVAEQAPSRTVSVAVVRFERPGFVAIHEDDAGKPGKVLGTSVVLPAEETKNLAPIVLSRMTKDGETLYAMLHLDDGDGIFDVTKDKPPLDSLGGEPVMMIFTVSLGASEPAAASP